MIDRREYISDFLIGDVEYFCSRYISDDSEFTDEVESDAIEEDSCLRNSRHGSRSISIEGYPAQCPTMTESFDTS